MIILMSPIRLRSGVSMRSLQANGLTSHEVQPYSVAGLGRISPFDIWTMCQVEIVPIPHLVRTAPDAIRPRGGVGMGTFVCKALLGTGLR